MATATWKLESCVYDEVRGLAEELGVDEVTASVLVRRGYGSVDAARSFLEGAFPGHDPFALGDMREAVDTIVAAVDAGARICVHGDYDADGICATALAVLLFRELGADVAWHLPSRFEEGYGLNGHTLTRLAEEGFDLVVTVDCGITAVAEVEHARSLGLAVVVTDHHRPAETFPACPVVATLKGDYPFSGLCGTAVVWKLAEALLGAGHPFLDRHLDLVALATVADVVPLLDENRAIARAGLRRLAQTAKPGLRALMRVAHVDPAAVDESSIGFRLAPRINASGRLCRPEAALALLLTEDADEAARLAEELEGLNRERQAVEERILRDAVEQIESWPESRRAHRGYVGGRRGLARGRDRDRRLAPRRAVQPAGRPDRRRGGQLEGLGPVGAAPSTCTARSARARRSSSGTAVIAQPPGSRSTRSASRRSLARSPRTPTRCCRDEDLRPSTRIDAIVPGVEADARPLLGARDGSRRSGSATPGSRCSSTAASSPTCRRSATASTCASACASADATPARRSRSGRERSSTVCVAPAATTSRSGCRRTAGTASARRSSSFAVSSTPTTATTSLREWLAEEWRAGESEWSPEARAIFGELELAEGAKRSLLESPSFRALLEAPPRLAEAA